MRLEGSRSSAFLDFLSLVQRDANRGQTLPVESYLERFPGIEDLIRAEFARLANELEPPTDTPESGPLLSLEDLRDEELIAHLRTRLAAPARYRREGEIGRGGMSRVYRARDVELARDLAMKVQGTDRLGQLRRFVREARVLGRLDHPGVLPIHELGIDDDGCLFFTMRLVHGQSLKERLATYGQQSDVGAHREVLEAVLRVCDTMAYAHAQGVIHRDLKPGNVMLGEFGAIYVVDWGLARITGTSGEGESGPAVDLQGSTLALATLDGDVLGTPAYMSPEQARGWQEDLGPASDVYAVGAILYHLLAGYAPYCEGKSTQDSAAILVKVQNGAPTPLSRSGPGHHPELVSITERAMNRLPEGRYASCADMAKDLRAYLDGRVVGAHKTGSLHRAWKWIRRNRALALAGCGALALAVGMLYSRFEANQRERSLRLLADLRGPLELLDEFETIWPAVPEHILGIEQWIARARSLQVRGATYERQLEAIRKNGIRVEASEWVLEHYRQRRAQKISAAEKARDATKNELEQSERGLLTGLFSSPEVLRGNLASLEQRLESYRAWPEEPETWNFRDSKDQLMHDRLAEFLAELDFVIGRREDSEHLKLASTALGLAKRADERVSANFEELWQESARVAKELEVYGGLDLALQRGLVPLGPDPDSGLLEFAHIQSGRVPVRDEQGRLPLAYDMSIVLILIPGGEVLVGAQSADPGSANFDPGMERFEGPPLAVTLSPFFLSKHEMTLRQWTTLTGSPEAILLVTAGAPGSTLSRDGLLPAMGMDGDWCKSVLAAYALEMPTSICWERAARGGTDTPWWSGTQLESLEGICNIADRTWQKASGAADTDIDGAVAFEDGYSGLAHIGRFRPNAFGLYDTIGNVSEWCRDVTIPHMSVYLVEGHELFPQAAGLQIVRGGHVAEGSSAARSAAREYVPPESRSMWRGVRPMRRLDP